MEFSTALELLQHGVSESTQNQTWADLGAGNGLFTRALADLLKPAGKVYAVDKDKLALYSIQLPDHVELMRMHQNFEHPFAVQPLDGILMANSLHFVKHKKSYLTQLSKNLKKDGRLILIEYDTNKPNTWVPYPVRFDELDLLLHQTGLKLIGKLAEVSSSFRTSNIYSALLQKED